MLPSLLCTILWLTSLSLVGVWAIAHTLASGPCSHPASQPITRDYVLTPPSRAAANARGSVTSMTSHSRNPSRSARCSILTRRSDHREGSAEVSKNMLGTRVRPLLARWGVIKHTSQTMKRVELRCRRTCMTDHQEALMFVDHADQNIGGELLCGSTLVSAVGGGLRSWDRLFCSRCWTNCYQ